jgi:hypothetical protein
VVLKRFDNEEASIQGLTLLILMIIFGAAAFFWLTLPLTGGTATAVMAFWAASPTAPDAAYIAGFENIARLNDGHVIAILVIFLAGLSFLIVALRSKFGVN